jgi:hypothetical protein
MARLTLEASAAAERDERFVPVLASVEGNGYD